MKRKILELLRQDARLTREQLARRVGATPEEVDTLIRELERSRAIYGYTALVNYEAAGEELVEAVIEVHVTPKRGEGFDGIAKRIYNFPEVRSLYLMSGGSDFLVFMEAASLKEIAKFVTEKLATMDGVKETQTHFLLKKYKQDGVALDGEEPVERLSVTP
ncbi:MAG: Lrp/AsnC family transcriptional regulator [Candidatus Hydrogenedentota bacterium]|jgi:DNA-binding Lrp family transcriptional regulator|uniref:Transcriptional regulator, AsnC family n=1 Tax=Sumerlaea chitinivorans TaxID=2250252 RepID=A0A2Z4Y117_SUMC1|nr:Transcriptional regulator, AsnC family [Candidatus Sumerlaea chitinivorans]MCX7962947.1 Lrp/AsnC family transcriptional regulator [Candidatus Sumerlaea chitinivorans]RMH23800.1 MAG: Lrp/AsnC family transcriptional regulator [Candidatus Hydrogenedentota bacterium]GIX44839.1 MAG: AsnC family transcriptional regulator [Candidatus Sumerlaea sp.]